jgi:DNA-binding HxlR family transcriptional regulator
MATRKSLVDRRVRGSTTGRPIMAVLDLLGRRWVLRVLWELRGEPRGFRELQAACDGMSPSVLNQRLAELLEALIVEAGADGRYALTARGRGLLELFEPLNRWAEAWARALRAV